MFEERCLKEYGVILGLACFVYTSGRRLLIPVLSSLFKASLSFFSWWLPNFEIFVYQLLLWVIFYSPSPFFLLLLICLLLFCWAKNYQECFISTTWMAFELLYSKAGKLWFGLDSFIWGECSVYTWHFFVILKITHKY